MKQISILFFILLLLGACVKAPTQTDNFVKIVDGRFSIIISALISGMPLY